MRKLSPGARSVLSLGAGLVASVLTQWLLAAVWYVVTPGELPGPHLLVPPPPAWTLGLSATAGGGVAAALTPAAPWRHATVVGVVLVVGLAALVGSEVLVDPAAWGRIAAIAVGNQLGALLVARRQTGGLVGAGV